MCQLFIYLFIHSFIHLFIYNYCCLSFWDIAGVSTDVQHDEQTQFNKIYESSSFYKSTVPIKKKA